MERAKDLGVYDWLISRGSRLWGRPADIADRLAEYRARGMTSWIFYGGGRDLDLDEWIRRFGTEVIPRLTVDT